VKKLISISVAVALLVTFMVPLAVGAQDEPPDTYAKTPFAILAAGIELLGEIVTMLDSKFALGLGFDVTQFTDPIADFTFGPLSWTVDMLAWGVYVVAGLSGPVLETFAPDMAWIGDLLNDLYCYFFTPFGTLEGTC
jgi:hypothetical protein